MDPAGTSAYRAAIVARTRFVEDLLVEEGIGQYVLLGAGLDTFAQRHPELTARLRVFEIDAPGPQSWKQQRLHELGYGVPEHLRLVPVDFESNDNWWDVLADHGFDLEARSVVSSSGVSMYITKAATVSTLNRLAEVAPGSVVVMTFMLPLELVDDVDRLGLQGAARGAQASGTPWVSFYEPGEIVTLARDAGFAEARSVPTAEIAEPAALARAVSTSGSRPSLGVSGPRSTR